MSHRRFSRFAYVPDNQSYGSWSPGKNLRDVIFLDPIAFAMPLGSVHVTRRTVWSHVVTSVSFTGGLCTDV